MNAADIPMNVSTVPLGADDAEGVGQCYWFVAIVKNNTEKAVAEKLHKSGYKTYLPIQTECRVWKNGRKVNVDRVIIPAIVFIRCTERARKKIVSLPYILRFMTNKASVSNNGLAIIPDKQIDKLRFMVGNSDSPISFVGISYRTGDRVRVARGKLAGLEGYVTRINDEQSLLTVSIDVLGCAKLIIQSINLEPVTEP